MEKKESRRKDMKKSKKKFIMFAILSVLLMANMKNVNAGQVQKNDKSVAIEELGCYYRTDLQRYYYVYMDPNMPMNGENVYVVNHIFPSELNGNTGYKFYYNPGNGDIYNNCRYSFY